MSFGVYQEMRQSAGASDDRTQRPDGLPPGAVMTSMCTRPPLEPDIQANYLARLRAATLAIRREVGFFPRALEIIQEQPLLRLPPPIREAVAAAVAATQALWARRGASPWEDLYTARCSANRDLFVQVCDELQQCEARPYTAIRSIGAGVLDFVRAVPERLRVVASGERARVEAELEAESRVPCTAIVRACGVIATHESEAEHLRQNLIEANLRLVAKEAFRLYRRASRREQMLVTPVDMFLDGIVGLAAAVDRYLPEHNTRFSTYAVHWIKQSMFRALSEDRLVPVPRQTKELIRDVARMRERLTAEHGAPPVIDEIYDKLKLSPLHRRLVQAGTAALRLSPHGALPEESEEGEPVVDNLEAQTDTFEELSAPVEQRESINHVARAAQRLLPASVREVIMRRYMGAGGEGDGIEPPTLQRLASERGVSRELMRLREAEGLALLSDYFVVLETRPARRGEIMRRILSPFEQSVVTDVFAEAFAAKGTEQMRRRAVRRLAAALVIDTMSDREWSLFARQAGLAPSEERRIAARLGSEEQSRGATFRVTTRQAENPCHLTPDQRPERTVEADLERLAEPLRKWWRSNRRI